MEPEASGRAFLGLIKQVKERVGQDQLKLVIGESGPLAREVFAQPIRVLSWYPYSAFSGFLRSIDRLMGRGDGAICRELGGSAGQRDLGTVFRIYRALASPERLIRSCNKVWPSYYRNAGRMEAIAWKPEETVLRISDFPRMDRLHCRLMEGWMIATMNDIGVRIAPGARETSCVSRGAEYHEFRCSWVV